MSKPTRVLNLAAFLFAFAALPLAAQSAAAVIEYASADDVTVIRAAKRVLVDDVLGFELLEGDQVQTGRGVFLEIRLMAGGAVLKLAENTTFVIQKVSGGQTSLALVYGRIRAKVEKLAGTDSFSVASAAAVAGVRGTDFGMDIVAPRGATAGDTSTRVYCFEGSVDVTALVDSAVSSAEELEPVPQSFNIVAGEMVTVSRSEAKKQAKKTSLDEAIRLFWSANDFTSGTRLRDYPISTRSAATSPSATPEASAPAVAQPEASPPVAAITTSPAVSEADKAAFFEDGYSAGYGKGFLEGKAAALNPSALDGYLSLEEAERLRRTALAQKGGLIVGGIMAIAGAGLSGTGLYLMSDGQSLMADYMLQGGIILSAVSLPFLIFAMFQGK